MPLTIFFMFKLALFVSLGLDSEVRGIQLPVAIASAHTFSGDDHIISAAPVQWQATSCSIDLNEQLLGGVRTACMLGTLDRTRCCPVLAAWFMAARSQVVLQPMPFPAQPGMPVLPDDSLVCIANMKAAFQSRGIHLTAPNDTCDVVTCFCNISLGHISTQACPLAFQGNASQPNAHTMERTVPSYVPVQLILPDFNDSNPKGASSSNVSSPTRQTFHHTVSPIEALALNCEDHSYRGCTRCLRTLRKELLTGRTAQRTGTARSSKPMVDCELIGLMWLLHTNKTTYIPTVSAILRALFYGRGREAQDECSPDTANMPLALDFQEILTSPVSHAHHDHEFGPYLLFTSLLSSMMLIRLIN